MGATWDADTSYPVFALQLALLGAGFGLTVAPTTSAVVDAAPADQRGAAASIVMVVRLLGLSVGLSALTAWGLARFNDLRSTIDLPPLTDPGFESALLDAQETLTAQAIAETFTAAAVVIGAGLLAALAMRRLTGDPMHTPDEDINMPTPETPDRHDDAEPEDLADDDVTRELVAAWSGTGRWRPRRADRGTQPPHEPHDRPARHVVDRCDGHDRAVVLAGCVGGRGRLCGACTELATAQTDLARVEAGAALYASQITGFQEQLVALEPQISAGVEEAIAGLQEFSDSTIAFDVNIDEVIPIDTEVVIKRTVDVPIKTSIPIKESFDTTIRIATPLGAVPLDVNVPVDIDVPIDLVVQIPIDETVPIKDEFPVKLDVPIAIDVRQTELANLTDSLAAGLRSLQDVLTGLSG